MSSELCKSCNESCRQRPKSTGVVGVQVPLTDGTELLVKLDPDTYNRFNRFDIVRINNTEIWFYATETEMQETKMLDKNGLNSHERYLHTLNETCRKTVFVYKYILCEDCIDLSQAVELTEPVIKKLVRADTGMVISTDKEKKIIELNNDIQYQKNIIECKQLEIKECEKIIEDIEKKIKELVEPTRKRNKSPKNSNV